MNFYKILRYKKGNVGMKKINLILIGINNSSYTKINNGTTQIHYIYNTIIVKVQHITTIIDLYFQNFRMRPNQNLA